MTQVVSVHSFRGGTGKSNITGNLATILAGQGFRVGIVDTDIQSPGIHVLFGLEEDTIGYTLNDYLWGRCVLTEAAYEVSSVLGEQTTAAAEGSLYLVPSSIRANEITQILREGYDPTLLNGGFSQLIRQLDLDYLFIDTHPGINEETLLSVAISDVLVIILRPDRQDYQGTAVTVDVARELEVPKMLLVVNKALSSFKFSALSNKIEAAYDVPVAGILPLCEEMAFLASGGIFSVRYPDHRWTQTVQGIAQQILD